MDYRARAYCRNSLRVGDSRRVGRAATRMAGSSQRDLLRRLGVQMIEVDARIIGGFDFVYRFYSHSGKPLTAFRLFANDDEAIEWFRANFPDDYKRGVEMRRYED